MIQVHKCIYLCYCMCVCVCAHKNDRINGTEDDIGHSGVKIIDKFIRIVCLDNTFILISYNLMI